MAARRTGGAKGKAAAATPAVAAEAPKGRGVDEASDWILEDEEAHALNDTLWQGVPALRAAAHKGIYMSPNPGEMELVRGVADKEETLFARRVNRSDNPNVWADSIRATGRLPFTSPIVFSGWDDELAGLTEKDDEGTVVHRKEGWVDHITVDAQTFDQYAAAAFMLKLVDGVVYSFVDNDPRTFRSPADRRAAKAQPRVTMFRRRHVRRITIELRNDVPRLKQIVLCQPLPVVNVTDPNNWVDQVIDARKVVTAGDPDVDPLDPAVQDLRRVRTQIYTQNESSGEWQEVVELRRSIVPDNPAEEMLDIPFFPHYAERIAPWRGVSPFLETAWTQAAIWCHNSELANLAREASLMHIHESGLPKDAQGKPVLADTRNARYHASTEPSATMKLLEVQGSALKSIMGLIDWKMRHIEKSHNTLQTERPTGPVTAREITLEGVRASSALEMWVIFDEAAWQQIATVMALLGGLPKRGVVSIPHDFGLPNSGIERNHTLYLGGKMSPGNYWRQAQRAGDVDESTFDLEAEIAWAEDEESRLTGTLKNLGANAGAKGRPGEELPPEDDEAAAAAGDAAAGAAAE